MSKKQVPYSEIVGYNISEVVVQENKVIFRTPLGSTLVMDLDSEFDNFLYLDYVEGHLEGVVVESESRTFVDINRDTRVVFSFKTKNNGITICWSAKGSGFTHAGFVDFYKE